MKRFLQPSFLPCVILGAGGIGILLRTWLLLGGTDDKGLLRSGHPAQILLIILTVLVLAVVVFFAKDLVKAPKYSFNYPASVIGAIGAGVAALGILITSLAELSAGGDTLFTVCAVMGLVCTPILALIALSRWKGYRLNVLLHGFVCFYMMLHLVCQYRQWSSDPQLMAYCFQLFCQASLVLSVFYRACFDADMGNRRLLVISHLAAVFFGLLSIPGSSDWLYYFSACVWMLTDLCSLQPVMSQRKE